MYRLYVILKCTALELITGSLSTEHEKKPVKKRAHVASTAAKQDREITLQLGSTGMVVTVSADYPVWEDTQTLEELIGELRHKRDIGLKAHHEDL